MEGCGPGVESSRLKPKCMNEPDSLDLEAFSLEELQSGSTSLLPKKFHCMGLIEQSSAPFLWSHGQPRLL